MDEVFMTARKCCPACASISNKKCFVVNDYDIKRCFACGTMYVETLPTPEALASIYTDDSYYELPVDSMQRINAENARRLSRIQKIKPKGHFLDIGCAHGLLLDKAKQAGYETQGVEPTLANATVARRKGHAVFNGWLSDFVAQNVERRFDVITCLDVIEHIDDPKSFMQLAASLLADDGLMVVSTPNYSGVIAKLLGAKDPYMTPPEHITFFSIKGMRTISEACGLQVKSVQNFGSLIPAEMDRSIQRYIPKPLQLFSPLIRFGVNASFLLMNTMNVGLEQELYLYKSPSK
jgi:2-polyprenyl-3-methyl-5-hydroxy-6-metoxy-1,4-benzoquinol methylase